MNETSTGARRKALAPPRAELSPADRPCQAVQAPIPGAPAKMPTIDWMLENGMDPSLEMANVLDRSLNYARSRLTLGLSPAALAEAYFDWCIHLAAAPGKQLQLAQKALRKWLRLTHYVASCLATQDRPRCCIEDGPNDKRFAAEEWRSWPYDV